MLILYFYIFQRGFEVLNAIFQGSVYVTIVTATVYYDMNHCLKKNVDMLLVLELLIYSKNVFSFSRIEIIHLFANS